VPGALGSTYGVGAAGSRVSDALVGLIPLAAGVAVNPLPVIALILILQTPRGRSAGFAFVGAWIVALFVLGGVAVVVANQTDLYGSGSSSMVARIIRGGVGALLLVWAGSKWFGRPRSDEDATSPAWMNALASTTPAKSARLGGLLAAGNPKNIALTLAAAAGVVETGLPLASELAALAFFVLLATLGVATPLVAYLSLGSRADDVLAGWGRWLTRHNASVMAIVLLVLGLLLVAGAVKG